MQKWTLLVGMTILMACNSSQLDKSLPAGGKEQMKKDIQYLASDELEGRDTGTEGEALAAQYISDRFADMGIGGAGDNGSYYQTFEFTGSPIIGTSNQLSINNSIIPDSMYYPLNFSGSGKIKEAKLVDLGYGIFAEELEHDDFKGKSFRGGVAMMNVSSPDGIHPHSAYLAYHDLRSRAEEIISRGARAILLYNNDETTQAPSKTLTENVATLDVPVLFLKTNLKENDLVHLQFDIERPRLQGKNVVALMDRGKEKTIVIGAHYDHLGHGISGSLHRGEPDIHNGADDNASGVAAMLQIALDLIDDSLNYNVMYIGFSGEERGLLGSNHFVKNPTIDLSSINYMMNMDMVGRLDTDRNRLSVNGVGTSPAWSMIDSTLVVSGLSAVTTESGTGPSDHMSFYLNDIPVLHFFSGSHEDYHKPSDDEHLINYDGIANIVAYMEHIIMGLDDEGDLVFTKTKEEKKSAASFKVTLGVVPDYLYEDKGMRIDGVSDDRPGAKAGMQKGDVIVKMGEMNVGDIYAYMEALSNFNAGESTEVVVLREGTEKKLNVTFD